MEDDEGLNNLAQKSLRRSGFHCQGVVTGADAILKVKEDIHLVLLVDQQLPDMDGTDLIRRLADDGYRNPFVAMTGHGDEKIAVEMMKLGARDYLIKGIDLSDILPIVFKRLYKELETEEKLIKSEKKFHDNQALYKSLLETTRAVVYEVDLPSLAYTYISPQIFEITGYPAETWKDFNFWINTLHPDDKECCVTFCIAQAKKGRDHELEYRMIKADNQVIWLKDLVSLIKKNGKTIALRGFLIDITEQKRMETQLQQSQKMESIGTLAGGIAHDFNNMLGVITGNISYALSNLNKNDELYEVLSDVQESSKQAQSLTHQLLTFSKGGEPIKKVTDINKLISESATFSIRGTNAKCIFELSGDLWTTEIDEGQINQVISNLLINANQAMPNGGTLAIRTENIILDAESGIPLSAGRYIKIDVEDQGVGISKKHLPNIFDPYFTTKQKGSGLGLATTYSIISRHGGNIIVHS
ncbi:response regulator, partial [Desulfobacterales bacterium HSG17]|nr:response regulator [Desulfobacterales bacterium HSG17]